MCHKMSQCRNTKLYTSTFTVLLSLDKNFQYLAWVSPNTQQGLFNST